MRNKLKYFIPVLSLCICGCSIDCLENVRSGSDLALPDSVAVLQCDRDEKKAENTVIVRFSVADYQKIRAEAVIKGYLPVSESPGKGYLSFAPYLKSGGIVRYVHHPNGSSQLAFLEDSSRKLIVFNSSNW